MGSHLGYWLILSSLGLVGGSSVFFGLRYLANKLLEAAFVLAAESEEWRGLLRSRADQAAAQALRIESRERLRSWRQTVVMIVSSFKLDPRWKIHIDGDNAFSRLEETLVFAIRLKWDGGSESSIVFNVELGSARIAGELLPCLELPSPVVKIEDGFEDLLIRIFDLLKKHPDGFPRIPQGPPVLKVARDAD